jgi:hypothetical protein
MNHADTSTPPRVVRGISADLASATTFSAWVDLASDPSNQGRLLLFFAGECYYFIGDDATVAAIALGRSVATAGIGPLLRVDRPDVCSVTAVLREAGHRVAICGSDTGNTGGHWRAHVDVTMGDRRVSNFIANAGLGITGVGTKERLVFNYSPGEEVGMERVQAAMENMIAIADAERAEFRILNFKVVKLEFIPE